MELTPAYNIEGYRVHLLKVDDMSLVYEIAVGNKTHEIRKADRDFRKGDLLLLVNWTGSCFTYAFALREITFILPGGKYGVEAGYTALSMKRFYEFDSQAEEIYDQVLTKYYEQNSSPIEPLSCPADSAKV